MIKKTNEHNGVKYTHFQADKKCNGVSAVDGDKFVINGFPKISITEGSYKYGSELQISIIAPKSEKIKKVRHPSNWNLLEINMPLEEGIKIITALYNQLQGGVTK